MKKSIIILVLLCVLLFVLPSCGEKEQSVHFLPNYSLSNYYEVSDTFSFNVLYLYTGDLPKIELVSLNLDDNPLSWTDFSNSSSDEVDACGEFKMGYVNIKVPCRTTVSVCQITFLVNGKTEIVSFDQAHKAKKHMPNLYPDTIGILGNGIPFTVNCGGSSVENVTYSFSAIDDISVLSFEFSDFVNIDSASVLIDDVKIGNLNEVLPLNVDEGSKLKIVIEKATFGAYEFADFSASFVLKYSLKDNLENVLEYFDVTYFFGITNQEVFEKFVSYWEQNNQ